MIVNYRPGNPKTHRFTLAMSDEEYQAMTACVQHAQEVLRRPDSQNKVSQLLPLVQDMAQHLVSTYLDSLLPPNRPL